MAETKSDQITNDDARPPVTNPMGTVGAHVRRTYFSWTVPVGNAAIADTAILAKVPSGARIVGGHAAWEAMTTAGAAATGELGDGTTAAKYLEATDMDAAGSADFADTIARNFGEVLAAELTLTLTVSVEAFAAGQTLAGYIEYMAD